MDKRRSLLLTFDYELFLGKRSGTVSESLITPTDKILDILSGRSVKGVFFVDTVYLLRMRDVLKRNIAARRDYERILTQLSRIAGSGHYIFPHLHPHWLDALYIEDQNQWDLSNSSRYRFDSLSEEDRAGVFEESLRILKEIIPQGRQGYQIDSYRAGGWSIQPFASFKPFFIKYGIRYDFSVLPGFSAFTDAQYYDFTQSPGRSIYLFEEEVTIENSRGRFTEFSISTITVPGSFRFWNRWYTRYLARIKKDRPFGNGISVSAKVIKERNNAGAPSPFREMISIELMNRLKLPLYYRFLESNSYMHFISHPKMISPHNLAIFERFLEKSFSVYALETDFKKMVG